ncbi:hypothetical protein VL04_12345 [Chromobacterium violaceum]|nr:hypothetical protein VL02_08770 [Chromobacterium violaceum]KMN89970.1 hypothetical protein VL04_12345 [Chromobacterium violaceum]
MGVRQRCATKTMGVAGLPLRPLGEMRLDGERCALYQAPLPESWRLGPEMAGLLPMTDVASTAAASLAFAVGGLAWQAGRGESIIVE